MDRNDRRTRLLRRSLPQQLAEQLRQSLQLEERRLWSDQLAAVDPNIARTAASSRASSSAAPVDHPGAEGGVTRTHIRQSVLYSRPRRRRTPLPTQEPPSEVSSSEHGGAVTDLPPLEVLPMSDPQRLSRGISGEETDDDHPRAEGGVTRTRIRQSVLYSNHPRRPRHRRAPLPTQEPPSEVSSSELGGAVTDLPPLEVLSLSDPQRLSHGISGEETDDDDECSHLYGHGGVGHSISPIVLTPSMLESLGDPFFATVPEEAMRRPDSDINSGVLRRKIKEYFDMNPPVSLEEAFESIVAVEYDALTALAAEKGTQPPRNPFLVDQELASLQAQQQDSAVARHSQDSTAISNEASKGVIQDGKQWMRDEVTLCFRKHVEKTPYLAGVIFELVELCHQCFNVENYMKVYHHYNFKIRMKMPAAVEWTEELYFGEVKEIFGTKFYFCCSLEPNERGDCYACQNQGVENLRHPVTGGFECGWPDDSASDLW